MGQVLHGSATTTEAVRRAIQLREESVRSLAKRYGVSPTTVQKWRKRTSTADARMGPKEPRSTVLTVEEEAIVVCDEHDIEHRLTKVNHPWTNGQVERMNRTIKDATVKRYHYDSHDQLRTHLHLFVDAYNHARRLKTLRGLTPTEFILNAWTKEPNRFRINPSHLIPGPYT
ncbi:hypothetical protein MPAR162_00790 [Methylorubrum populi]|uniref:integrase core domain-containing protein n=1 Tax=Methylorubrum populi TaxID=223967 RepID=UPI002F2D7E09